MAGQWPLVGREDEVELLEERLGAGVPTAVVVAGSAGVGKTRLVNEILARAAGRGQATGRIVASRAAATVPFGAFAPLLPDADPSEQRYAFLRRAVAAISQRGGPQPMLLAIDDGHHLDDASATLVHQLALEGRAQLLITIRTGEPPPDSVALLWKDGLAERLELQALARAEVDALVRAVLSGPVEGAVLQHLWAASQGNPLYLRELLLGALDAGAVAEEAGLWRLRKEPGPPPRLQELVEQRLGRLDVDERNVLELLAVAESVGLAELLSLADAEVVERLERRQLVVASLEEEHRRPVRLAHPLYGDVLRAAMPLTRAATLKLALADAIAAHGMRRRLDATRVAALRLDAGAPVPLQLLEAAVRESFLTYDLALVERMARAGVDAGGGPAFTRLLAESVRWQGRCAEAEALLAGIDLAAVDDEDVVALTGMTRAECLFRGLGRAHEAFALLDELDERVRARAWREEIEAHRGMFDALAGRVEEATVRLRPLLESPTPRVVLTAASGIVPALTMSGKLDEAVAVAERAFALSTAVGPQPMIVNPGLHLITRAIALCDAGRLEESSATAHLGYDWSLESGSFIGQTWSAMVLGWVALSEGRLLEARERLREAAAGFRDLGEPAIRKWCLGALAQAAGACRDLGESGWVIAELDAIEETPLGLADVELERGRAWVEVAQGRVDRARDRLRDAARHARETGVHGLEAFALQELVRLNDPSPASRLDELRHAIEGPLHPVRADHAAAFAAGDGPALDTVSEAYEALGALLWAAEAAAQAAVAHRRATRLRLALASEARSFTLADRCEGAATPALRRPTVSGNGRPALTRRELEIATLAAAGTPSRAIASQLYLSVRTVENHLQRVYTKLGVSSRSELAGVIDATRNE